MSMTQKRKNDRGSAGALLVVAIIVLVIALTIWLAFRDSFAHIGMTCTKSHVKHVSTWVQPIMIGNTSSVIVHPAHDTTVCDEWGKE